MSISNDLAKIIQEFMDTIPEERQGAVAPSREQFTRLLSAPSSARKVPGIPVRMNEDEDYHCSEEEAKEAKAFLERMYRIKTKDDLINCQRYQFMASVHYEQFMTFWKEAPLFDVNELNPKGRESFESCLKDAEVFYPLIQEHGLYAWDISEYINLCRIAASAGIISDEDFREIVDRFVCKAQAFYSSFKEYALSYLCGAVYFMGSENDLEEIGPFLEIQKKVVAILFSEDAPWNYYSWYRPKEREWAQIYPGNMGCLITKAAYENGIGYMYREEGSPDHPDSGWRFFKGDEPDEYVNNPENITVVSLNTICNLRPDILAYLEAPVNSAYGWNGKDWEKEPFEPQEEV